ncbi:TetR/AcrR family transcriptional regulator [Actinopolyspora saharensis]|uniref:TetR/AcrR family transcriptional regulator n=1 Tax=Actinopolyspora saharensis TaxID=995062 RepID=UPI003F67255E
MTTTDSEQLGAAGSGRRGQSGGSRKDPGRRERIARAAITVVAERGIERLTHRAVAAAAEVPLGSTTYHFATLDDLLAVALRQAAQDNVAELREYADRMDSGGDLAAVLTDLVLRYLGPERKRTVVEHELYVAALHRPALRSASTEWDAALRDLFTAYTDEVTGKMLAAVFCGLLWQGIVREPVPDRDEIEMIFRRALGTSAAS